MDIPHIIIFILCIVALVLLLVRTAAFRENHISGPDVGGSMTIGGREVQEDCFSTLGTPSGLLAVLADGMGKAYGGRIASKIAVDTFIEIFREYNAFDNPQYFFRKAFHAANRAILRTLENDQRGAASVGAVMVRNGQLYYAVVGNVKVCVYRDGDLVPVSSGHTMDVLAEESFKVGKLSRQDAVTMLENHRLYNYVGQDGFKDVELFDRPIALKQGDVVALLTDGVYELLPWREIEEVLAGKKDCQTMAYQVIEKVNLLPEDDKDNASIVLLRAGGEASR